MTEISHLRPLIAALAAQAAQDYLTAQAAPALDSAQDCTKHVPLPDVGKAA